MAVKVPMRVGFPIKGFLTAALGMLRGSKGAQLVKKRNRNRATAVDVDRYKETSGIGQDWAKKAYGDYYAISVPVHAAIKIRSEAISRPPLVVLQQPSPRPAAAQLALGQRTEEGRMFGKNGPQPVGDGHPAQQLLDRVNRWYSRGELWRATEIYLNLWGSAFWALERDERGQWGIWPLRPDRVRILPDKQRYIRGYVYYGLMEPVAYTSEEIIWIRYFNPLEEFAGLSPLAPLRLSADMGLDALKYNRNFFKNSAQPDVIFTTEEAMSDEEVEDFYERWEKHYKGPGNAHRPDIASFIKDIKTLGFSPNPPKDTDGRREDSGRGWVRELQGRWPGLLG